MRWTGGCVLTRNIWRLLSRTLRSMRRRSGRSMHIAGTVSIHVLTPYPLCRDAVKRAAALISSPTIPGICSMRRSIRCLSGNIWTGSCFLSRRDRSNRSRRSIGHCWRDMISTLGVRCFWMTEKATWMGPLGWISIHCSFLPMRGLWRMPRAAWIRRSGRGRSRNGI